LCVTGCVLENEAPPAALDVVAADAHKNCVLDENPSGGAVQVAGAQKWLPAWSVDLRRCAYEIRHSCSIKRDTDSSGSCQASAWPQREILAANAGVSPRTVYAIELEGVQPTRATRVVLAMALSCGVADLFPPAGCATRADGSGTSGETPEPGGDVVNQRKESES
jgi:DNA-binding XRE family transcriptional regulator